MISPFGVKIGGGSSSPATVQNSDLSYTTTVNSGDTLNLPDITVTDSDGSTFTAPSVQNVTCTPATAPVGATLIKTGQTTSYRTGDDGDLEVGRATSFTVLASNNPFGNTNRFTDELGGQTYTNNIVIDWSTYDGTTVLGYRRTTGTTVAWASAIDSALIVSIGSFTTGWRLPNVRETINICNFGAASNKVLNYSPFNISSQINLWTSTTCVQNTSNAYLLSDTWSGSLNTGVAKTIAAGNWIAVRTFTVTGTILT